MTFRAIQNIGLGVMIAILAAVGLVPTLIIKNSETDFSPVISRLKKTIESSRRLEKMLNVSEGCG